MFFVFLCKLFIPVTFVSAAVLMSGHLKQCIHMWVRARAHAHARARVLYQFTSFLVKGIH